MHNSIYEVSRSPVPASQRARAGNMPDWFFERVCDYAENPTPRQRVLTALPLWSFIVTS